MDLMYATCSLSLTTAKKLAGQHTNGDVEEAMRAAETARTVDVDMGQGTAYVYMAGKRYRLRGDVLTEED